MTPEEYRRLEAMSEALKSGAVPNILTGAEKGKGPSEVPARREKRKRPAAQPTRPSGGVDLDKRHRAEPSVVLAQPVDAPSSLGTLVIAIPPSYLEGSIADREASLNKVCEEMLLCGRANLKELSQVRDERDGLRTGMADLKMRRDAQIASLEGELKRSSEELRRTQEAALKQELEAKDELRRSVEEAREAATAAAISVYKGSAEWLGDHLSVYQEGTRKGVRLMAERCVASSKEGADGDFTSLVEAARDHLLDEYKVVPSADQPAPEGESEGSGEAYATEEQDEGVTHPTLGEEAAVAVVGGTVAPEDHQAASPSAMVGGGSK